MTVEWLLSLHLISLSIDAPFEIEGKQVENVSSICSRWGEVSDEQVFIIQSYKILMTPNLQDYNNKNKGMSFPSH